MEVVEYETGGGVVVDGDLVMVLERLSPPEIRLPKGHIDPGEDAITAAVREVLEESGYRCRIVDDLGAHQVEFDFEERRISRLEHYFLMEPIEAVDDGEPQFLTRWVSWDEAAGRLTFDEERNWLHRAHRAELARKAGEGGG
ncbi:MAG: NUDIX domain-containing protein [Acidimicrobiia bacterium]|nr:NUDIX domain-containing protein [Acidimicrobiia bacterium]